MCISANTCSKVFLNLCENSNLIHFDTILPNLIKIWQHIYVSDQILVKHAQKDFETEPI